MALTTLQYQLLNLIAHSEYSQFNGHAPTEFVDKDWVWFWPDELAKSMGISGQALGGVLSSLTEAGLLELNLLTAAYKKKHSDDDSACLTLKGWEEWVAVWPQGPKGEEAKNVEAPVEVAPAKAPVDRLARRRAASARRRAARKAAKA